MSECVCGGGGCVGVWVGGCVGGSVCVVGVGVGVWVCACRYEECYSYIKFGTQSEMRPRTSYNSNPNGITQ